MKQKFSVSIWVTRRCNFRCTYCYEKSKYGAEDLSYETANRIIDFVKENIKEGQALSVHFHGGEPTLNFEVIKHIVNRFEKEISNEKTFGITTNCSVLDDEMIDYICAHMARGISLSIDGNKETHELNRKCIVGNVFYEDILKNALRLREKNDMVRIRMTYTPRTAFHLYENIKYLIELGFSEIVPIADFCSKEWTSEDFDIVEEQFKNIKRYLFENNRKIIDLDELSGEFRGKGICSGGRDHYSVNVNGDIYPCIMVVGDDVHKIGNVFTGLDKEKIEKITKINCSRDKVEACGDCELSRYCESTRCLLVNYALNGDYYKPNLVNCNLMNIKYNLCDFMEYQNDNINEMIL